MSQKLTAGIPFVVDTGGVTENSIVKVTTGQKVALASAVSDAVIGVAEYTAAAGETVSVQVTGVARVKAGGVIAAGDPITTDASAQAVKAAPAAGTNNVVIGRALSAAASGDLVDVLLIQHTFQG